MVNGKRVNRVLRDAFAHTLPPVQKGGRQLKFYYAAQTGTRPPRVTLFVNKPELNTPSYQTYLTGRIRNAFELAGVPVILKYRSSHDKGGGAGGKPKPEAPDNPEAPDTPESPEA